jgi:hypothetical protein
MKLGIDEEELWYLDTRRFGLAVSSFRFDLDLKDQVSDWNDEHTRRDSFQEHH